MVLQRGRQRVGVTSNFVILFCIKNVFPSLAFFPFTAKPPQSCPHLLSCPLPEAVSSGNCCLWQSPSIRSQLQCSNLPGLPPGLGCLPTLVGHFLAESSSLDNDCQVKLPSPVHRFPSDWQQGQCCQLWQFWIFYFLNYI